MPRSPSIAPALPVIKRFCRVFDDLGERLGRAWRETGEERTARRTVITDLLDGQYSDPVQIVAVNTAEGWSRDVSKEIADELAEPPFLERFVEWHRCGRPRHLPSRGAA